MFRRHAIRLEQPHRFPRGTQAEIGVQVVLVGEFCAPFSSAQTSRNPRAPITVFVGISTWWAVPDRPLDEIRPGRREAHWGCRARTNPETTHPPDRPAARALTARHPFIDHDGEAAGGSVLVIERLAPNAGGRFAETVHALHVEGFVPGVSGTRHRPVRDGTPGQRVGNAVHFDARARPASHCRRAP